MSPLLPHHPRRVTHPEAHLTEVPGVLAIPGEAQEPTKSQRQPHYPTGAVPQCCGTDCSPGRAEGPGRATGAPVAPWGSQHPPGQAGRNGASPCTFPHGAREIRCTPGSLTPPPPPQLASPHSCPFPSPLAGTDSGCLFLPQKRALRRFSRRVNAICRSPAARGQECRVGAGEPSPAPRCPQHRRELRRSPPTPTAAYSP